MLIRYVPEQPTQVTWTDEFDVEHTDLSILIFSVNNNDYSFNGNVPLEVPDQDAQILLQNNVFEIVEE